MSTMDDVMGTVRNDDATNARHAIFITHHHFISNK